MLSPLALFLDILCVDCDVMFFRVWDLSILLDCWLPESTLELDVVPTAAADVPNPLE